MKILYIEWGSYGERDVKEAFTEEGHQLISFSFVVAEGKIRYDPDTEERLRTALRSGTPDAVFSVDYFPVIARGCQKEKIRYISWTYDCPHILLYSKTIVYPCNTAYVFDKEVYREFHDAGVSTVHYMPLGVNVSRMDRISPDPVKDRSFAGDVSFVGSLYVEEGNWFDEMQPLLTDYTRGYLDAVMAAQLKIQGCNFVQELLGPVSKELCEAYPQEISSDGMETPEFHYAQRVINRKITAIERIDLLNAAAQYHTVDLFTHVRGLGWPNIREHGPVDYNREMPLVFKQSRINLNITLRSIKSGIPLRAMDIMGCGGFLLSNFQADFLDHFVPGEDFVFYESKEDLLKKIDYYLTHEEERKWIARNGHDKVAAGHTCRHRVREMLEEGWRAG